MVERQGQRAHRTKHPHEQGQPIHLGRQGKAQVVLISVFVFGVIAAGWYLFSVGSRPFEIADAMVAGVPIDTSQSQLMERTVADELSGHVVHLAENIGERNLEEYENLCEAADYLHQQLAKLGYTVSKQEFKVRGLDCFNVIAEIQGSSKPEEILVVGAHYDSVKGSPGANDNGTGVASMLALARMFSKSKLDRTIRFVGFTNEEPPYFHNVNEMGSSLYAQKCRAANEKIIGVLSLETMGYYSDESNSQNYPPPLSLMYPSTGNFIGFVGNLESREFLDRVVKAFREKTQIPSEAACLPGAVQGVGWSDQWSFWQEGYVGIMVTDTAPFRYPHYHLATDTPDKIDFETLAKVVEGLENAVRDLATAPVDSPSKENENDPDDLTNRQLVR